MQAIYLSGLFTPPPLCSALGRCGRCRVRYLARPNAAPDVTPNASPDAPVQPGADATPGVPPDAPSAGVPVILPAALNPVLPFAIPPVLPKEQTVLTPQELAEGWRLSCLRQPEEGLRLELPPWVQLNEASGNDAPNSGAPNNEQPQDAATAKPAASMNGPAWAMAVDFGSTSLHFARLDNAGESGEASGPDRHSGPDKHSGPGSSGGPVSLSRPAQTDFADFKTVNPQMGAGSDIMSRLALAASAEGRKQLHQLSLAALRGYLRRQPGGMCREICLAANPAMTMILLNKDASGLRAAPYRLDYTGGQYEQLPGLPPVWVAPLISPFVGGDLSAGYASIAMRPGPGLSPFPFLLADLGTNGEFILALNPEKALATSIPLGPALEGSGLACGTEAREGAITGFQLGPQGLLPLLFQAEGQSGKKTDGAEAPGRNAHPRGISGAAYLQLLHLLRKHGLLRADGSFEANPSGALGQRLARNFFTLPSGEAAFRVYAPEAAASAEHSRLCPCPSCAARPESSPAGSNPAGSNPAGSGQAQGRPNGMFPAGSGPAGNSQAGNSQAGQTLFLAAGDVEELLKIKASFSLALQILLAEAALPFSGLKGIFLAGALGFHCPPEALEGLGFVPPGTGGRLRAVGNASLSGAALLLRHPELRPGLTRWASRVKTLAITDQPDFMRNFVRHMNFPL